MTEKEESNSGIIASEEMKSYFQDIIDGVSGAYEIATQARKQGFDPETYVEVKLAKNMAERVIGLISTMAPQIVDSGAVERIIELENEYGKLDWRVAFKIAEEIAQKKFCNFDTELEAIEIGVRTGFAYVTVGVVTAPLEGLSNIEIKNRQDGEGQYFCLNFAGPVRNAGGTAAATCVLIADYVRKKTGYAQYDPTEGEISRIHTEISDYHERVTNLQYFPSREESEFLGKNIPVEISGDASERIEVSNHKDLSRVPTNFIRSGYCLLYSSCVPLKAEKLWKKLSKWGKDFDMDQWNFLEDFVALKKKMHAKGSAKKSDKEDKPKITPDHTFIADLVAGRPILGYPMRKGGFRLRYGRSRTSGYSAQSIHPATMHVLCDYIATATQLKVERPGKGAAFTPCDTIQGPIVKLKDGSVVLLDSEARAKSLKKEISEVIFIGDVLINYGDFFDRAHILAPPGYCEEWWIKELKALMEEKSLDIKSLSSKIGIPEQALDRLFKDPLRSKISFNGAKMLSIETGVPLHPLHTFHWRDITSEQLYTLVKWLRKKKKYEADGNVSKLVIPSEESPKEVLEILGLPHQVVSKDFIVLDKDRSEALLYTLSLNKRNEDQVLDIIDENKGEEVLTIINKLCPVRVRDKSGIYIGTRMGRPEKAKMRKMTGNPHGLFPVGEEGGRMRSLSVAVEAGKVTGDFPKHLCESCGRQTVYAVCDNCYERTKKVYRCSLCGEQEDPVCEVHGKNATFEKTSIDVRSLFKLTMKKIGVTDCPDLIKGVKGTSNHDHIPEHISKSILRAYHGIYVNKDGTIRYDCSEIPVTHFKPKEIGVDTDKLKELGYLKDIRGAELVSDDQILEIKPQDMIIPCCPDSPDDPCDEILFKTTKFIDDLLVRLYGLDPFYNLKSKKDLVGHYVIGLAPHTSAGSVCRIVGFSKTQGFLSHPLIHAAMRRDCDGDESCLFLVLDAFLNFSARYLPSTRGGKMDAPLVLTSVLTPGEVDDMAFAVDTVWDYPLEFYQACEEYKMPWDVKIPTINDYLDTPQQYEGMGFTHDTDDFNAGVLCSAYKTLPSMDEKLAGQMEIAERLRSVETSEVARLVIEKHFIRDTKGNLRKFSQQTFRCVKCNTKYRRPPLVGRCTECSGKLLFTISEGSVIKYLDKSINLAEKYGVPVYLKQTLRLLKMRVDSVFGKEKETQAGLAGWIG